MEFVLCTSNLHVHPSCVFFVELAMNQGLLEGLLGFSTLGAETRLSDPSRSSGRGWEDTHTPSRIEHGMWVTCTEKRWESKHGDEGEGLDKDWYRFVYVQKACCALCGSEWLRHPEKTTIVNGFGLEF